MNEPFAPPTRLPPAVVVIVAAVAAAPFSVTADEKVMRVRITFTRTFLPLRSTVLNDVSFFLATFSLICVGMCRIDCVSTVPAALAVPLPGLYGVKSDVHRKSPLAVGWGIPDAPTVADNSFAPNVARPGVPAGRSGGGRQTTSFAW